MISTTMEVAAVAVATTATTTMAHLERIGLIAGLTPAAEMAHGPTTGNIRPRALTCRYSGVLRRRRPNGTITTSGLGDRFSSAICRFQ